MIESLVSTIIPVHNRAMLLDDAVSSVINQTYRPIEIIIVDDGSTDDTAQTADALAAAYPGVIHVLHQHNGGVGAAREAGRQIAKGEFIQYLDSDDLLLPGKFALQVAGLREDSDCNVAYGKTVYRVPGLPSDQLPWKRTGERIDAMFPSFLQSRWWGTSTPLYRRAICDAAGPWLRLSSEEDWEYDCRIAAFGARLHYVDEFVSEEREHSGPRLSRGGSVNPGKLRDRAIAHALILEHARQSGIGEDDPEMRHFARALFLLSRQCGAAGLQPEAKELFTLAKSASGTTRGRGLDFRLYEMVAGFLGWPLAGKIACSADRWRA